MPFTSTADKKPTFVFHHKIIAIFDQILKYILIFRLNLQKS